MKVILGFLKWLFAKPQVEYPADGILRQEGEGWYFVDEDDDLCGPYASRQIAERAQASYYKAVDAGR